MRFMHWSWHDLMSAPQVVVDEIMAMIKDEAEEAEMQRLLHS